MLLCLHTSHRAPRQPSSRNKIFLQLKLSSYFASVSLSESDYISAICKDITCNKHVVNFVSAFADNLVFLLQLIMNSSSFSAGFWLNKRYRNFF